MSASNPISPAWGRWSLLVLSALTGSCTAQITGGNSGPTAQGPGPTQPSSTPDAMRGKLYA